ncbi:hypothetical protein NEF87_003762 [Candidatus Lokiarchaeum ossiferum]|uniref:Uncharacterized protein n=1 Tax=Candidatus Lokiarchaeum ossiferum TaxID=2951803 RepID=A0ABY6HVD2_9ARCH|nr:hypothetical protein NEF87_003762 [Candidatus Lokiarchaeum sp. B-35]
MLVKEDLEQETFHLLYQHLNQINLLGQIYSRAISKMASDEISDEIYYKIQSLEIFMDLIIIAISEHPLEFPLDISQKIDLKQEKFTNLQEQIRPIKKMQNHSLTTIEHILEYILQNSRQNYKEYSQFLSWEQLVSFVFGTDISDKTKGAKKIEQVNIKEQILYNNLQGPLINEISQKYDGIIAYTMSLLTMISTTDYSDEFNGRLNKILEKLGSSTQITLLQNRLLKTMKHRDTKDKDIKNIHQNLIEDCKSPSMNCEIEKIERIFGELHFPIIDLENRQLPPLKDIENFSDIFTSENLLTYFRKLKIFWNEYNEIFQELQATLKDLLDFFNSIIKTTNKITADLFSRGFQASIPLHDIETCERAGIHIKNIAATSSNHKTQVSDKSNDMKLKLLRKMEKEWKNLEKILKKKSMEEDTVTNIGADDKIFSEFLIFFQGAFIRLNQNKVFSGYREEVNIASRILYSIVNVEKNVLDLLKPIENLRFNTENRDEYKPIIYALRQYIEKSKSLIDFIILVSNLAKQLWQLNREYVMLIGEDTEFILSPEKIEDLIKEIPVIIKREFQQRLITSEKRKEKQNYYIELMESISKLKEIPIQQRMWLLPCSENDFDSCVDLS